MNIKAMSRLISVNQKPKVSTRTAHVSRHSVPQPKESTSTAQMLRQSNNTNSELAALQKTKALLESQVARHNQKAQETQREIKALQADLETLIKENNTQTTEKEAMQSDIKNLMKSNKTLRSQTATHSSNVSKMKDLLEHTTQVLHACSAYEKVHGDNEVASTIAKAAADIMNATSDLRIA